MPSSFSFLKIELVFSSRACTSPRFTTSTFPLLIFRVSSGLSKPFLIVDAIVVLLLENRISFLFAFLHLCERETSPENAKTQTHFFINSSTAAVIALTPVRKVGSGKGSNKLECSDGRGLPDFLLASTLAGST